MPEDTILEPVEVELDGSDYRRALTLTRAEIERAKAEIDGLQKIPTPTADIRARVECYVESLASAENVTIGGISGGELTVDWPTRNPLSLALALVAPEVLKERLLARIHAVANDPMSPASRLERIAALQVEIDEMQYREEALVSALMDAGDATVRRSFGAHPHHILQVRVPSAERKAA